jgi:hypothetical protein
MSATAGGAAPKELGHPLKWVSERDADAVGARDCDGMVAWNDDWNDTNHDESGMKREEATPRARHGVRKGVGRKTVGIAS